VTIEATEAAGETASPEENEHVDSSESVEASVAEEGTQASVVDETESAVPVDEEPPLAGAEADAVASEEEPQESDRVEEVAVDAEQANDEPSHAADDVEMSEEAFAAGEPVAADEEAAEPPQAEDETEHESGGLVSAVNEVLARLVEPFEAAKTAAPAVATEGEHVDEL